MRAVNLLPRELEDVKKGPSKPVVAGCAGAVLATAVLAAGYLNASSGLGTQNRELDRAQAQLAATPPPAPPPASVSAIPQERQARVAALSTVLAQRIAWDRVLREVSLVLPDDVWLTNLTGQVPAATGATPGQGLRITGFTYSQAAVARLLARLTVIPDLSGVTLNSATEDDNGARPVVQFDIGADLHVATAAAPVASTPPPVAS